MANRFIYNVQDVFVGSSPNEKDATVTGIAGHEVLRRIDRVQSFNYSLDLGRDETRALGKTSSFSKNTNTPPSVSLSISCLAHGVNTESRIGLNTNNENVSDSDKNKTIFHDMAMETGVNESLSPADRRNIYLAINDKANEDIRSIESNRPVYTSDFTVSALGNSADPLDGWIEKSAMDIYRDSSNDSLLGQVSSASSMVHYARRDSMLTVGKKYKLTGKGMIASAATNVDNIRFYDGVDYVLGDFVGTDDGVARGTWASFSVEWIARRDYISFYMQQDGASGGEVVFAGDTTNDKVYLKDIVVTEIAMDSVPHEELYYGTFTKGGVQSAKSVDYGLIAFQNCYLNSYSLKTSVGQLPTLDLGYAADSMVGYASASGVNVPYLDTESGSSKENVPGTSTYAADWSFDEDGWGQDGFNIAVENNNLIANGNSDSGSNKHIVYKDNILTVDKNYRVTGKVKIKSSSTQLSKVALGESNKYATTKGSFEAFDVQFVATQTKLEFKCELSDGTDTWAANDNDDIELSEVTITQVTELIIPKYFDRESSKVDDKFIINPGGITVSITKPDSVGASGFYDDSINSCSIDSSLQRKDLPYIGHKLISNRPVTFPIETDLSLETLVSNKVSGDFMNDMKQNGTYDVTVTFRHTPEYDSSEEVVAIYTFSGAKFNGVDYSSAIGSNKTASIKFSTQMDLENKTAGLFVSGQLSSLFADVVLDNGDNLVDNNNSELISMPVYLQY